MITRAQTLTMDLMTSKKMQRTAGHSASPTILPPPILAGLAHWLDGFVAEIHAGARPQTLQNYLLMVNILEKYAGELLL